MNPNNNNNSSTCEPGSPARLNRSCSPTLARALLVLGLLGASHVGVRAQVDVINMPIPPVSLSGCTTVSSFGTSNRITLRPGSAYIFTFQTFATGTLPPCLAFSPSITVSLGTNFENLSITGFLRGPFYIGEATIPAEACGETAVSFTCNSSSVRETTLLGLPGRLAASATEDCSSVHPCNVDTPPEIDCPDNIETNTDPGQCSAVVTYPDPTVTGSPAPMVNCAPSSGSAFPTGTTTVNCTAANSEGSAACSFTVTVRNSEPVITSVSGPSGPLALGTSAGVTVQFADADVNQSHTCTFDWDDGNSDEVSVGPGVGTAAALHTYTDAGVYSVTVTVADPCTSASQVYEFIVIYDPEGGFVTGGGCIHSPVGAYVADPGLVGMANFGFVSKYKNGANVPTGETEFQFNAGDLSFKSTTYQWLVVGGPKAQFKGTGTINGAGSYNFLLTATDGQLPGGGGVDKFRIKITSDGVVIYDNVPGESDDIDKANPQAISAGSIVIHK